MNTTEENYRTLEHEPDKKTKIQISDHLLEEEYILSDFFISVGQITLTNIRLIISERQGISGTRIKFTSIPYSRLQSFSVETSALIDKQREITIQNNLISLIKITIHETFDSVGFSKILLKNILKCN